MTVAAIFPGQGSQKTGMLKELADEHSVVTDVFAEASDLFGQDLWGLAQTGPDEALGDTRVTQPLMFTGAIAVWRAIRQAGLQDQVAVAGHSLEVLSLCNDLQGEQVLEAVNFNAPGQVAISGHLDAIEKAVVEAKARGARKAVVLPVSVPNHSSLMKDAGDKLVETIDGLRFQSPKFPVVQNADAVAAADLNALTASLKEHVYSPVQWTRSVQTLRDQHGVTKLFEIGPGKVLTGLNKRIDKALPCMPVNSADTLTAALGSISPEEGT